MNRDSFLHSGLCGSEAFLSGGSERGFTIIELLISMAIASVVAMSGFALFSASNWSYQVQENVGEAQQNARIAMDRIIRDIRTAGFGLPESSYSIFGFDSPITVSDSSTGPDTITILGIGYEDGNIVGKNEKGQKFICYSSTTKSSDWPGGRIVKNDNVVSERQYISIDGVFHAELSTTLNPSNMGPLDCTGADRMRLPLKSPSTLKGDFDSGKVYIIQAVEYSIVNTNGVIDGCSVANPCLVSKDYSKLRGAAGANVGRQLLAENIEDIQFAYGLDANGDGKLDYTTYTTASFEDSPSNESSIRAVRITLAARTRHKDTKGITFKRPAIENHPESAPDNYRRRILTRIVKLRN